MRMRKGFVFSVDAVFALYITLLATSALFAVIEASNQPSQPSQQLAALALDSLEVQKATYGVPGEIVSDPSSCATSRTVGSPLAWQYAKNDRSNGYEGLVPAASVCIK